MTTEKKNVYQLISLVAGELANTGISKNQRNNQGTGYNFRGIDDVYNAIGPLLAKNGLSILPRTLSRDCVERVSGQGKALFYVTVDMEFDFVSAHDGSKHTVKMYGEAMDSGDKATNKAMSAAYKYAMFQAFCIPTEGDNDADSQTHTVASKQTVPAGYDEFEAATLPAMREAALNGSEALAAAFQALPKSAHKAAFWQAQGPALKKAAKAADEQGAA
ncbi:MAG: ERF family protein [Planctomycetota bacterium]